MGKKNEKLKSSKSLQLISSKVNKKGRIKGKNKKQTQLLRGCCCHYIINKKGKVKSRLERSEDGEKLFCTLCGEEFDRNLLNDEQLDETVGAFKEALNQYKLMSVKLNNNIKGIEYGAQLGGQLAPFKKMYKRSRNVIMKQKKVKNNKKNNFASNSIGSWRINRSR